MSWLVILVGSTLITLVSCFVLIKAVSNGRWWEGLPTLLICMSLLIIYLINGAKTHSEYLFFLYATIFFFWQLANWSIFMPDKASKASNQQLVVIGYVRRFNHTIFYNGPAKPFNGWWNRAFGFSNFNSGLIVRNLQRSIDGGGTIIVRFAIRANKSMAFSDFNEIVEAAPHKLYDLLGKLLRQEATAEAAVDELTNFCRQYGSAFDLQKVNYYENRPINLVEPIRKQLS